jgi:hypothetical protein
MCVCESVCVYTVRRLFRRLMLLRIHQHHHYIIVHNILLVIDVINGSAH